MLDRRVTAGLPQVMLVPVESLAQTG